MENMLSMAKKENIRVDYFNFAHPLKGIYFAEHGIPPCIGLSNSLRYNVPLLRSVMAEELGHHFTSVGQCISREFYHYATRITISKIECKALRWAANHLISDSDLLIALHECSTPCELAEYFYVTPEIVKLRLELFEDKYVY